MAAPATTVRGTPIGIKLKDGFSSKIAFNFLPNASFWEKKIKPPGVDGGDAIPQSTMLNTAWRTFASRSLKTLQPITVTAAYDPQLFTPAQRDSIVNNEGSITVYWADGSRVDFYGYCNKIEPGDEEEGAQPEVTLTITPTNYDPVNHVEVGPVYTEVLGT